MKFIYPGLLLKMWKKLPTYFLKLYLEKVRIVLPSITFVKAALIERSKTIKKCLLRKFWNNQIEMPWKIWHLKQEESLAKEQCTVKVTNQFSSAHLQCTMQQQAEKLIHSKSYLMLPLSKVLGSIGDDPELILADGALCNVENSLNLTHKAIVRKLMFTRYL